jgi:hypothetical protein
MDFRKNLSASQNSPQKGHESQEPAATPAIPCLATASRSDRRPAHPCPTAKPLDPASWHRSTFIPIPNRSSLSRPPPGPFFHLNPATPSAIVYTGTLSPRKPQCFMASCILMRPHIHTPYNPVTLSLSQHTQNANRLPPRRTGAQHPSNKRRELASAMMASTCRIPVTSSAQHKPKNSTPLSCVARNTSPHREDQRRLTNTLTPYVRLSGLTSLCEAMTPNWKPAELFTNTKNPSVSEARLQHAMYFLWITTEKSAHPIQAEKPLSSPQVIPIVEDDIVHPVWWNAHVREFPSTASP